MNEKIKKNRSCFVNEKRNEEEEEMEIKIHFYLEDDRYNHNN